MCEPGVDLQAFPDDWIQTERGYRPLLEAARAEMAAYVNSDDDDLVFVENASDGCNSFLRSLRLQVPRSQLQLPSPVPCAIRQSLASTTIEWIVCCVLYCVAWRQGAVPVLGLRYGEAGPLSLRDASASPDCYVWTKSRAVDLLYCRVDTVRYS